MFRVLSNCSIWTKSNLVLVQLPCKNKEFFLFRFWFAIKKISCAGSFRLNGSLSPWFTVWIYNSLAKVIFIWCVSGGGGGVFFWVKSLPLSMLFGVDVKMFERCFWTEEAQMWVWYRLQNMFAGHHIEVSREYLGPRDVLTLTIFPNFKFDHFCPNLASKNSFFWTLWKLLWNCWEMVWTWFLTLNVYFHFARLFNNPEYPKFHSIFAFEKDNFDNLQDQKVGFWNFGKLSWGCLKMI